MTEIPYCDETWNLTAGCTKCELGCKRCWAVRTAKRLKGKGSRGYDKVVDKNGWTGHIELMPWNLDKPLHWKKPRTIFVNSMSDLFHPKVPFEYIDKVFGKILSAPRHTYLIFTKQPKRMFEWVSHYIDIYNTFYYGVSTFKQFESHIQFILSISTQAEADEKIPILLQIPAAVRGLSIEPLLERIDLHLGWAMKDCRGTMSSMCTQLHWLVSGCESLSGLKPGRFRECEGAPWVSLSKPEAEGAFEEAVRHIVRQGKGFGVPVYVKQLPINGKVSRNPLEWPEDLRIQQIRK